MKRLDDLKFYTKTLKVDSIFKWIMKMTSRKCNESQRVF